MTSELIRQRSDLIDTQVIAKDTGKRLGIVKELLVDIDSREVVALGLRDSWLAAPGGLVKYMFLSSIEKMGDVILVPSDDVIEDLDPEAYTNLINCEVITETGDLIGKVRGFKFDANDGKLTAIIIASFGLPLIPDQVISTYELSIDEVVSSGPNRLIVFEGSEERLTQLSVGFLERIGLGKAPWEDEYAYNRPAVIRPENQLPAGTPVAPPAPVVRAAPPVAQTTWDDDNWQEVQVTPAPQRLQAEARYYDDDEGENWDSNTRDVPQPTRSAAYQDIAYTPVTTTPPAKEYEDEDEYEDIRLEDVPLEDVWGDDTQSPGYQPQKVSIPEQPIKVNIPEPVKQPEYQEEEQ